ncbi:sugar transferase [Xylanibacillus composti]|uniref:Multidrug MFS transporter n=1 Tax=Xylanibacillus composti TaxID=1572762 RepID=A0A8J4H8T9_9BACL|nr:sugar transferase [Xylanibacillus composti]GIQ71259.1 multidrug MFS transporter [Xylanibacillus composti]
MEIGRLFIKRIIDVFGSFLALLFLSPILFLIAILIKLDSKGSIFYKQLRLGKEGQVFEIIKFRTMIVGAENIGDGLKVRGNQDSRITRIGRVLRDTSLDELPQLINVLKGDMSLVGPRPPVPHHPYNYEDYSEEQKVRFSMKPGITGLSQITVRNSVSWDERILIDLQYVKSFTIKMDIKIMIGTIFKLLKRENIYLSENQYTNCRRADND